MHTYMSRIWIRWKCLIWTTKSIQKAQLIFRAVGYQDWALSLREEGAQLKQNHLVNIFIESHNLSFTTAM